MTPKPAPASAPPPSESPETIPRWVIAAPLALMHDAAAVAGLDGNALRQDLPGVQDGDAWLVLPSFFCERPADWLTALAHLVERDVPLRLYLLKTDPDAPEEVHFSTRLYPRLDADVRDLLTAFSHPTAEAVEQGAALVELAFDRLRAAASAGSGGSGGSGGGDDDIPLA